MSSWGLGNTIFKITIFTWVFKYLVPNLSFFFSARVGGICDRFFWKFQKPVSIWVKDFSKDFTNPRAPSARREGAKRPMRAQFSKLGVLREGAKRPMRSQSKNWGWGKHLFDGVDGWDGDQKCPLNFFILCGNIEHIYIYIFVYKIKIVTNIPMGFKTWCQVGGGVTLFSKLPDVREFSNIWFQKLSFFFPVPSGVLKFINFFENFKFSNLQQVGDLFFLV